MGIKKIYEDGFKELKRQKALFKEKRNLSQKEKELDQQLTALGKKAWETQVNIDAYGNSKELLTNTHEELQKLNTHLTETETGKQELESAKTTQNEQFDSQRKEVENVKREVDGRLAAERNQLKEAQREASAADSRLKQIASEQEKLKAKEADPQTPAEQKPTLQQQVQALESEKPQQESKRSAAGDNIRGIEEKIKPIQRESETHQKEIDRIREQQRQEIGKLEEELSTLNKDLDDTKKHQSEMLKEMDKHYHQLGDRLAGGGVSHEAVAPEMETVTDTRKAMGDIRIDIQNLDHQGSPAARSALWKMVGVSVGFLAAVVIIIILLVNLLGPSKKEAQLPMGPFTKVPPAAREVLKKSGLKDAIMKKAAQDMLEGKTQKEETGETTSTTTPATPVEAMKKVQEATGELKKRSEALQGGKITVADKETLVSALPVVSGWRTENTSYQKGGFGQIEQANLKTEYLNSDGKRIDVNITDAGTASAILSGYKMFLLSNRVIETDDGYEKITTINGSPVIEKYRKQSQEAELIFILKDRYLVQLEYAGEGSAALLKEFAQRFDLSKLQ